jgi:HEAT repeat protein
MEWVAPIVAGVMFLAGLGFLLNRRRRQPVHLPHAAAVSQQHLYLFQGGKLSESELESIKAGFRGLLERGERRQIESGLRAGTRFAVEVRALTEIGSPQAGAILERLLQRRLSPDPMEQSWYRLDLAHGLRLIGRPESLPALLQCFPANEAPLQHYLAAEIACFPGFERYLEEPETAPGQAALRVLHLALVGLRNGVQPQVIVAGRLGEAIELVWEQRHWAIDPAAIRVLIEAVRLLPRADHAERAFDENRRERDRFRKQIRTIAVLAEPIEDYLADVGPLLLDMLPGASTSEQERIFLQALIDLKADTGPVVRPLLEENRINASDLAIESLAASANPAVGSWLCDWTCCRRAKRRSGALPYRAVLSVLRHFPSPEAEGILLAAAREQKTEICTAGLGSLGWWEPLRREAVLACLHQARSDRRSEVRRAAEAALARLGERQALQWFRQQFSGECTDPIHHAIQLAADEGVLLLWPDLDHLADAEDADVAYHACEALEQMRESCSFSGSLR